MLSDAERFKKTKVLKRKPDEVKARFSDAQKIEAAKLWLVIGNNTVVAATLDIPLSTLNNWKAQNWWKNLIEDLRHESSIKLSSRLKAIAEKSFDLVEDRLENGDFIYDQKTGELRRKPMMGKDVARIAADFVDKAIKIESKPREEESVVVGRLEDLASRFEALAKKKDPVKVTDVIYVDAA
jgi:transposase-like protein